MSRGPRTGQDRGRGNAPTCGTLSGLSSPRRSVLALGVVSTAGAERAPETVPQTLPGSMCDVIVIPKDIGGKKLKTEHTQ